MKVSFQYLAVCVLLIVSVSAAAAQKTGNAPLSLSESTALNALVKRAADSEISRLAAKNFTEKNISVTVIDLRNAQKPQIGSFRGAERIYPASVVKMFYLAAVHQWLADGRLRDTPELRRGLRDMIVDSSNDATHYMVDVLTDAPNGAELAPEELVKWAEKRNVVNRYFTALGYTNINVNQKTYCEDIFGRERQFWDGGKNRNGLTTDATARLLAEIALRRAVSTEHSNQMLEILKRDPLRKTEDADNQDVGYTGMALKREGVRLWSKAGWTSTARHDAAYVETPEGLKFVLVTFTTGFANEREIIPSIARVVMQGLQTNN